MCPICGDTGFYLTEDGFEEICPCMYYWTDDYYFDWDW